jgi:transposase
MLLRKYLRALGIPHAVIMVWEYLTTQMCHVCQKRMVSVYADKIPIRGLKLCKSTTCSKDHNPAFRNRDGNAARNLVICLEAMVKGQNRPKYLCPQPKKRKSKKTNVSVAP